MTEHADQHSTFAAQPSVASDRERLERELEGGGAPSQRPLGSRPSLLMRLWRAAVRRTEMGVIWFRILPLPR